MKKFLGRREHSQHTIDGLRTVDKHVRCGLQHYKPTEEQFAMAPTLPTAACSPSRSLLDRDTIFEVVTSTFCLNT